MTYLPYGKQNIEIDIPHANIITSRLDELVSARNGMDIVREAMNQEPHLSDLARNKQNCTIIISDHTRPVPSKDILPLMLSELRRFNPQIDITLLVATGCHRLTTLEEIRAKVGDEIADNEKIRVHDCDNNNVDIGVLPSGAHLIIDKLAIETDLLIAEGFIEPHFFAGFSGGRKSILPGICARKTVLGNHCGRFIDSKYARTGILANNPIHEDMVAAVKLAKLQYIVNVIIDEDHRTVAAFAGDPITAHEEGVDYLRQFVEVESREPADICITTNGGAPLDQNVYQCVKSMTAAEAATHEGSTIIICAECADGVGGEFFRKQLTECERASQLYDDLANTPQDETEPDAWQSQVLARILATRKVIFVTGPELENTINDMKMQYAPNVNEALKLAYDIMGRDAKVSIIPNGISVIVKQNLH